MSSCITGTPVPEPCDGAAGGGLVPGIPGRHRRVGPIAGLAQLGLSGACGGERLCRANPEGVTGDATGHAGVRGAALHDLADGGRGQAPRRRMVAPPNAAEQCAGIVPGAVEVGGDPGDGGGP